MVSIYCLLFYCSPSLNAASCFPHLIGKDRGLEVSSEVFNCCYCSLLVAAAVSLAEGISNLACIASTLTTITAGLTLVYEFIRACTGCEWHIFNYSPSYHSSSPFTTSLKDWVSSSAIILLNASCIYIPTSSSAWHIATTICLSTFSCLATFAYII